MVAALVVLADRRHAGSGAAAAERSPGRAPSAEAGLTERLTRYTPETAGNPLVIRV
ncbi:hypothetical protein AB0M46_08385 [Dactylosporangium sp. NPDC051485]|uniref:hypothetical protein n=1 Tax=Dactylosporangium sp. NPDC051485 TaxID=3154846 RepID=UPI00343CA1BC